MPRTFDTPIRWLERLWRTDAPLTATGLGMAVFGAVALGGLWLDPRTVAGAPVWLKPAKFGASIAIYTLTMAWIFTWLGAWPRTRRLASRVSVVVFVVEVAIIALQAARGTTSHFNTATVFDGVLFSIMGVAIVLQSLASVAVLVALWRQHFEEDAMGWALRLGMAITIVAAFSGGLMTRPTAAQIDQARATGRMLTSGAHTVGAPDGGPGLPGTGWSTTHGDLRVAHFAGLHAIQVLPLAALALARLRRWNAGVLSRLVRVIASSYAGVFLLLAWQALRAQPLTAPDAVTVSAVAVWLLLSAAALLWAARAGAARRIVRQRMVIP